MNTTHADGHRQHRGLRGDPVLRGTTDDGTRDTNVVSPVDLAQLYPQAAESIRIAFPEACRKDDA